MDIVKFNASPQHLRAMMIYVCINFQEFINKMEEETLCILMSTSLSDTSEYTPAFEKFMPIFINIINWKDNISATTSIYIATMAFVDIWSEEMSYHWRTIHDIMHTIYSTPYEEGTLYFTHNINRMHIHFEHITKLFITCMPLCEIL